MQSILIPVLRMTEPEFYKTAYKNYYDRWKKPKDLKTIQKEFDQEVILRSETCSNGFELLGEFNKMTTVDNIFNKSKSMNASTNDYNNLNLSVSLDESMNNDLGIDDDDDDLKIKEVLK